MRLTHEEEQMLAGKQGYPVQKAMEILVQLGDIYGAENMIEISKGSYEYSGLMTAHLFRE